MSLKYEQYRSLVRTRTFLRRLLARPMLKTKEIREQASSCLRHYPMLKETGEPIFSNDDFDCPKIFSYTEERNDI